MRNSYQGNCLPLPFSLAFIFSLVHTHEQQLADALAAEQQHRPINLSSTYTLNVSCRPCFAVTLTFAHD